MVIQLFTGKPGSGMSYHAVEEILKSLTDHRIVYTNIYQLFIDKSFQSIMDRQYLTEYALRQKLHLFPEFSIPSFWNHIKPGALVVIDEAQYYFDKSFQHEKFERAFESWVLNNINNPYKIILCCQNTSRLPGVLVRHATQIIEHDRRLKIFKKEICNLYNPYGEKRLIHNY